MMNRLSPFVSGFFWLLLLTSSCAANRSVTVTNGVSILPDDVSKAGADGPFVFYRGPKIVVKSVVMNDTTPEARKQVFRNKKDVMLTCTVTETGDAFSFPLHDSIGLPADVYPTMPARLLALSDIEGNFLAFKTMLMGAKVIDERFNWTFGNGHLVLLGDYFDRGVNVTQCLWLAYKLEAEAAEAGGQVHFILGNHEIMNMSGDQRYVRHKYFANAELIGEDYRNWYAADTELGQWLRSRNAIERIGDHVFCHAGLSSDLAQSRLELTDINRIARRWYGTPENKISDPDAKTVFGRNGVFWYRDMAKNKLSNTEVTMTLGRYGANRVVVGHTLQPDVRMFNRGRVICIDLMHEDNLLTGSMKCLLIEQGAPFVLDNRGNKTSLMVVPTLVKDDSSNEE
jgi:hypothetical protein